MNYFNELTKEEFGWTAEDKLNQMNIDRRYLPLLREIS